MNIQELEFSVPWGFSNPWVQSFLGQVWPLPVKLEPCHAWEIALPNGEFIVATHTPPPDARESQKAVVIVHGLGGHQELFHILRFAQVLGELGYHVLRMNMRGRGPSRQGSPNALRGGHSDDLALLVQAAKARLELEQVELLGYSFGGNMVLRYAGAMQESDYPSVQRCFAVSSPVDLAADVRKLKRVFPSFLQKRVSQALVKLVQQSEPEARLVAPIMDFDRFEAQYIGPFLGGGDSEAFYRSISAAPHLHKIQVPTHVIWSKDDPVVDVSAYANYSFSDAVQGHRTQKGGHVGFCLPFRRPPQRWWLDALLRRLFEKDPQA